MISFPWSQSRYLLGIYIGVSTASAVLVERSKAKSHPIKHAKVEYPSSLNEKAAFQSLAEVLPRLLYQFDNQLRGDYIPVQIALADSLVNSAVFELDQMPKNQSMKNQLLAMRFQKECHINMQNADLASQVMENEKQKTLYAVTAPAELTGIIQSALRQQHNLKCMDKAIHYVFNYFYEQLLPDAAMLFSNAEYWTLILWDADKNVIYFRTKLHAEQDQLSNTADDVLRLLYTYQQQNQNAVSQLYVLESDHSQQSICEAIKQRDNITILPLNLPDNTLNLDFSDNALALFAAQPR